MSISNIDSKRKALFGTTATDIAMLIVTPMPQIYELFRPHLVSESKGWFTSGITYGKNMVVNAVTGTPCEDAVFYAPNAEKIIFAGYCGSVDEPPGTVFSADKANSFLSDEPIFPKKVYTNFLTGGIYQVRALHEEEKPGFLSEMATKGCMCFDMESYGVFQVCLEKRVAFGGIYVISDNLSTEPYYNQEKYHYDNIASGVQKIVNALLNKNE